MQQQGIKSQIFRMQQGVHQFWTKFKGKKQPNSATGIKLNKNFFLSFFKETFFKTG